MFPISETRAKKIVQQNQLKNVQVKFLVHPSPASPAANAGWADLALKTLTDLGVIGLLLPPTLGPSLPLVPNPAGPSVNPSPPSMTSSDISSLSDNLMTNAANIASNHINKFSNLPGPSTDPDPPVDADYPYPPGAEPSTKPNPSIQT